MYIHIMYLYLKFLYICSVLGNNGNRKRNKAVEV
jgi:hypothetical protein